LLKRFSFILAVGMFVLFYVLSVSELSAKPVPDRCTAAAFRPFAAKVWSASWQRGAPAEKTIRAARRRIACAPPGHARAMRHVWSAERASYRVRRAHCLSGPVFAGRVSEFSGGATADGVHVATEPGIALRSSATLGDTFRLRTEAGTSYVTQTDWGPADWTGRTIDITTAQMARMGWVPTDSWGEAKLIPGGCI
jgi:hypothetical protein